MYDNEKIDDGIENTIIQKTNKFFNLYKTLDEQKFSDYLDSVGLSDVFNTEEEQMCIWSIFLRLADGGEISSEVCIKGIKELFGGNTKEFRESNLEERKSNIKSDERISTTAKLSEVQKNTSAIENTPTNKGIRTTGKLKPSHERKITKVFTEIDIDKIQQLRKVFSLLDLRNKESVSLTEIQEVMKKYKFIKLSQDELITFLNIISDDLKFSEGDSLSINFELYSRAISAMEQQLLKVNSEYFTEKNNDSYEITENYVEMIEDLNSIELENIDYIMVLADMIKFIEYRMYDTIVENYEKLLQRKFIGSETSQTVHEVITEGISNFKNKIKDIKVFLKEMNSSCVIKQNKLSYLKLIVNKIDSNLKSTEEDFRNLFQKYNMNQPIEIDDETEKLMEENTYLNNELLNNEMKLSAMKKENEDKNAMLINFQAKLEKLNEKLLDYEKECRKMSMENEKLRKNYDVLRNEIYEKITNEGNDEIKPEKANKSFGSKKSLTDMTNFRDRMVLSDEGRKIFELNYEQLVMYTLNVETMNKQLEEISLRKDKKISELESELKQIQKSNDDLGKNIHIVKSENSRLQTKVAELTKEVELNKIFRPSNVLNQVRISRIGEGNNFNFNANRISSMKPTKNLFEVNNQKPNNNIPIHTNSDTYLNLKNTIKEQEPRISQIVMERKILNKVESGHEIDTMSQKENKIFTTNTTAALVFTGSKHNVSFGNKTQDADNFPGSYSLTNNNTNIFSMKESYNDADLFKPANADTFDYTNQDPDLNDYNFNINGHLSIRNTLGNDQDKQTIIDCIEEESPFETKENDNNQIEETVNLSVYARHSPLQIEIDMDKMKKLKRASIEIEEAAKVNKAISNTRVLTKPNLTHSLIKEQNEDESNADNQKPEGALLNTMPELTSHKEGSHVRMDTMYLENVFVRDSQYTCYDFLTLRKNMGVMKMLEDNAEYISSYEMFSDNVYLLDENNKKSKKYIFITSNSIYILRPYDVSCKLRFNLKDLNKITISNKNCNLIAFHFNAGDDLLLEILRRMELLYFFRDLFRFKGFGKLKFKYSDNFKIKRGGTFSNIIVNQANNFFIAPNFENAQKLGYLAKMSGGFFSNKFNEKLVVLTNVGLLYFDDPNKPPKKLIPIIGSDIQKIDEKKYKRKFCFEIRTLNGESYVFATKTEEELDAWLQEFKGFKKNYEKKMKVIDTTGKTK